MGITKQECRQISRWILIGVGTFFIYFYIKDKIMDVFPVKEIQLIIGILLLGIAARYFNLTKYYG